MKLADVKTLEDGSPLDQCIYWAGSRQKVKDGDVTECYPVIALARGKYVTYRGECGPAVKLSTKPGVPEGIVVAKPHQWTYLRYLGNETRAHWNATTFGAQQFLLTNDHFQEVWKMQRRDRERHAKAKLDVKRAKTEAAEKIRDGLVPAALRKYATISATTMMMKGATSKDGYEPGFQVIITIPDDRLLNDDSLTGRRGRAAIAEYRSIKDPTC